MKKIVLGFLLVFSSFFALQETAQSAPVIRYVSAAANTPAGNDSAAGTFAAPYLTLRKCITSSTAGNGDFCEVRGGSYATCLGFCVGVGGSFALPSGTSYANALTIEAYNGEVVNLTVASANSIFAPNNGEAYIIFKGMIFDGTGTDFAVGGANANNHIRFQNIEIKNSFRSGMSIHGDYWEFLNLDVHNNGNDTNQDHGIYVSCTGCLVDGGKYHDNKAYGIQFFESGHFDHDNNVIRNTRIYNNAAGNPGAGGMIMANGHNNIAYNNLVYNNGDNGMSIAESGGCANCALYNNTVFGNFGAGILIGLNSVDNAVVKNNIVYNNGSTIQDYGTATVKSNNSFTDPSFTASGSADFTLLSSSNAINACLDLHSLSFPYLNLDFAGNARPNSAWDCGAYLYVSPTCVPSKLIWISQPLNKPIGFPLGLLQVGIANSSSVVCPSATTPITLSKNGSATYGALYTTESFTKTPIAGIATWTETIYAITIAGSGSITAAASGLTSANSSSVTIGSAAIMDPDKRLVWQGNVGVTGDIPTNRVNCVTTECNTLNGGFVTFQTINDAITSAPSDTVVRIPAGTWTLHSSIIPKSNVTIRGAGMGVTSLVGVSGWGSYDSMIKNVPFPDFYLNTQTSYNLSTIIKGDTTITVASGSPTWSIGDYIHVDATEEDIYPPMHAGYSGEGGTLSSTCRNPETEHFGTDNSNSTCHLVGQTVRITSTPGGNIYGIDTPIFYSYIHNVQATKVATYLYRFGVEDITFDNTPSGVGVQNMIEMANWMESWVLRNELIGQTNNALFCYGCTRVTIRGNKVHDGFEGSGSGYSILLWNRDTGVLIEDNICYHTGNCVLLNGGVTGNVIAYNYETAMLYGDAAAGHGMGSHAAQPLMNLFEGNIMDSRFRFDYTHGTVGFTTLFRNAVRGENNPTYYHSQNLIDLWALANNFSIIGNVLGSAGNETIYQEPNGTDNTYHSNAKVVYAFGEISLETDRNQDVIGISLDRERTALQTVYRHGNWDSVTNGTLWDNINLYQTIPDSMYLASKPAWFGGCTWPAIGPDLVTMTNDIPAKRRYVGAACGTFSVSLSTYIQNSHNVFTLTGSGTSWLNGTSVANFGANVTVNSFTVTDIAQTAIVDITVSPTAQSGIRTLTITTNSEVETIPVQITSTPSGSSIGLRFVR